MFANVFLAGLHYVFFAVGVSALISRKRSFKKLQGAPDASVFGDLFKADRAWTIALIVVIATGLIRMFGGFEKPTSFYIQTPYFHIKLTMVALIFLVEIAPMVLFMKWRWALKAGQAPEVTPKTSKMFKVAHMIEFHLYLLIPFVAAAMARGLQL